MKKGFVTDGQGNIKSSWVWSDESIPCPFPNDEHTEDGDFIFEDTTTPYETFHSDLICKNSTRKVDMVTGKVISKNSGREVLSGTPDKQEHIKHQKPDKTPK